ncbi:uncharacterized protein LOC111876606 [Lactuca sativa]|uniref:uncharacterized protein LOC111876606 n=1 Tax=Lactuca sativa TaxID=4236 RepID=UPI000CD84773|nr:uncharacterized protein LOC111876606 [Lactuca sativa]
MERPKPYHSQSTKSTSNDNKGKGKIVLELKVPTKTRNANHKETKKKPINNEANTKHKSSDSKETNLKDNKIKVIRDEQFDTGWYIDSGRSRHMIGRKEELREFKALKDSGNVKYGNNSFGRIKGYGMIKNGYLSICKVPYVEGLQHNLVSVLQLVVGIGLKVSFDDEGLEIIDKKTIFILLISQGMLRCIR